MISLKEMKNFLFRLKIRFIYSFKHVIVSRVHTRIHPIFSTKILQKVFFFFFFGFVFSVGSSISNPLFINLFLIAVNAVCMYIINLFLIMKLI